MQNSPQAHSHHNHSVTSNRPSSHVETAIPRRHHWTYRSYKAQANSKRTFSDKVADFVTAKSGSMLFLFVNLIWFGIWITINLETTTSNPFDPYPFGFLTMAVSLEAIVLAIIVLISQNREQKINEIREETLLLLNTIQEKETTKILEIVRKLAEKQGIDLKNDPDLERMLQKIDLTNIERKLEKEI
ncbi:MAG: DUF1003 domain-containing protein [Patescibacteria group bacterium]